MNANPVLLFKGILYSYPNILKETWYQLSISHAINDAVSPVISMLIDHDNTWREVCFEFFMWHVMITHVLLSHEHSLLSSQHLKRSLLRIHYVTCGGCSCAFCRTNALLLLQYFNDVLIWTLHVICDGGRYRSCETNALLSVKYFKTNLMRILHVTNDDSWDLLYWFNILFAL